MEIGVDIVYIPRLEGRDDLAQKILSEEEYEIYCSRVDKAFFLAGRFACREAFVKANKGQIDFHQFKKIRVLYDAFNAPYLMYEDRKYSVSIAHDKDYAIAIVVVER